MTKRHLLLGELLIEQRLISETQLAHALSLQHRSGGLLGDILIGEGAIGPYALYRTLAGHLGLAFIDLLKEPPDPALLTAQDVENYLQFRALPWRRDTDGRLVIALCNPEDEYARRWLARTYGQHIRLSVTSPVDIRRGVENAFGPLLEEKSRLSLWERLPQASARVTLPTRQKRWFGGLLMLSLLLMATHPAGFIMALLIFCQCAYGFTMLFKCWIFMHGQKYAGLFARDTWTQKLATLDEYTLPVYTVLIPMHDETESLPGMLAAMRRLDYPASKLDLKLVLEADDERTFNAACALKPRYQFEIIRVPPGQPRTKPKACNYALNFARGEYITVFDADDRPDRLQLKKAVHMFRNSPPDVACLQARLNYYNANDNLLTRFFSLEYTILFHFLLTGLERIGIPLPLGGTSNHMPLERLREVGEWDPYNVTEDADLGTRLAALGFRTAMLDSFTMEEATNTPTAWIRQRSRWIKGYMQTWLVYMRRPRALYRKIGLKAFIGFQFFIGFSSFTFLTAPILWGLALLWAIPALPLHRIMLPVWFIEATAANFLINILTNWYCSLYSVRLYRKHAPMIAVAALLYPFYLVLHSVSSYKALWQLFVKPHFWEKTRHGMAHTVDPQDMRSDITQVRVVLPKRRPVLVTRAA